jgi:hypothetical protein
MEIRVILIPHAPLENRPAYHCHTFPDTIKEKSTVHCTLVTPPHEGNGIPCTCTAIAPHASHEPKNGCPTPGVAARSGIFSHAHSGPLNESVILRSVFRDEGSLSSQRDFSRRREFSRHISPSVSTLSDREQSSISSESPAAKRPQGVGNEASLRKPRRGEKIFATLAPPDSDCFPATGINSINTEFTNSHPHRYLTSITIPPTLKFWGSTPASFHTCTLLIPPRPNQTLPALVLQSGTIGDKLACAFENFPDLDVVTLNLRVPKPCPVDSVQRNGRKP